MQTFTTASALSEAIATARVPGCKVGFVPTMGALHHGHAALIRACRRDCDLVVASIFVNPTQFNDSADLETYPRTPDSDRRLLEENGCDLLYLPDTTDVYPEGADSRSLAMHLDYGQLTERLEGAQRPGHFAGVVQVVSRLLGIVCPDVLYLGQKDYQQVAVLRRMVKLLELPVAITVIPTVREQDGLALSSRNRRLSPDERLAAGKINQHLAAVAAGLRSGWPARDLERLARDGMAAIPVLQPEYVEVIDGTTLLPYQDGDPVEELVVAAAVRVGEVRLIDNRIAYRANPEASRGV
ncbi:pantothenate synthetase [Neolewinella xylanilytica]|uniref:Pantothenate synthetase n=1 Tax=Neolewinella xylanilytica TaxID=1514080 RepID=A0A2S6I496_9BACT|nr:pantoate--beta-alanine ligase [Neolewinella xylanilytica]PPK85973.1 pantothenate synthetase [Neolewinella xylanilytica]